MNEEQHLTYELGMTNVPSDATCDDNGLEESIGLTYADGEHRVIQKPVVKTTVSGTLLFVHDLPNGTSNYIVKVGSAVKFGNTDILTNVSNVISVSAVGRTLIINTSDEIYYVLWTGSAYKTLGSKIPEPTVKLNLDDIRQLSISEFGEPKYASIAGFIHHTMPADSSFTGYTDLYWESPSEYEEIKTALQSIVTAKLNKVKELKRFAFPFWVRWAVRLYDGQYTYISNPILMMPSAANNRDIFFCKTNETNGGERYPLPNPVDNPWPDGQGVNYLPLSGKMQCEITCLDILGWEDIIAGIDIFVSEEQMSFKLDSDWTIINWDSSEHSGLDAMKKYDQCSAGGYQSVNINHHSVTDARYLPYFKPTPITAGEMASELLEKANFYKIAEVNVSDFSNNGVYDFDVDTKMTSATLPNLVNQTRLEVDDYFSHSSMTAQVMKVYNMRLHLAQIKRSMFDGFKFFTDGEYAGISAKSFEIYVYIETDSGKRIVKQTTLLSKQAIGLWFYYPDPRANKALIFDGNDLVASLSLTKHKRLNGAYYFAGIPEAAITYTATASNKPALSNAPEDINNRIMVSEANNPFVFNSRGDVYVGQGKVLGMATQVMAVGQEEHGIHPLIVFTDRGTGMLLVNKSEGTYTSYDEYSREVCSNPKSITEVDGPVFFASKKGLMVTGSNDVKCVSEQLSGKSDDPFVTYLQTSVIAYDYRDGLLWLFDTATHGTGQDAVTGSRYCWIYNIKSGTFARYDFGTASNVPVVVTNIVNYYPDFLLQIGNDVYSLLNRPDANNDNNGPYSASIITRAMKLGGGLTLKSIMRMKNVFDISGQNGSLSVEIWAKNNLNDAWVQLTHLRGVPHKYYQLRYTFTGLLATDRFAGTVLITQERRTNKLR